MTNKMKGVSVITVGSPMSQRKGKQNGETCPEDEEAGVNALPQILPGSKDSQPKDGCIEWSGDIERVKPKEASCGEQHGIQRGPFYIKLFCSSVQQSPLPPADAWPRICNASNPRPNLTP